MLSLPSPVGRSFLDRRRFLADLGAGLGGIALAALLAERASADVRPDRPLAARPPHFEAKAKRWTVISTKNDWRRIFAFE